MRLRASGSRLATLDWLVTLMACRPRSISSTPTTNQATLACPHHSGSQDSSSSAAPRRSSTWLLPWSAQLPARLAIKAPVTPARPTRPICASLSCRGALDSTRAMVANITLTAAKASALARVRWRSAGWVRSRCPIEASTCAYGRGWGWREVGSTRRMHSAITAMATAVTWYTRLQPPRVDRPPATLRDSKMPTSRPLSTRPTLRPACPGAASAAAMGTSTWAATENRPATSVPSMNMAKLPDQPTRAWPTAASSISTTAMRRRSSLSPSGVMHSRPTA